MAWKTAIQRKHSLTQCDQQYPLLIHETVSKTLEQRLRETSSSHCSILTCKALHDVCYFYMLFLNVITLQLGEKHGQASRWHKVCAKQLFRQNANAALWEFTGLRSLCEYLDLKITCIRFTRFDQYTVEQLQQNID